MLTPKQQRFVAEYLIDLNATQAAIRAGYKADNARVTGPRMLSNVAVAEAISVAQVQLTQQSGVTVQRVVEEMARIGFADIRALFDADGKLRPIHLLPEDAARSVAGVDVTRKGRGDRMETVTKVKTWDKPRALEQLAKHLGMFNEKSHVSGEFVMRWSTE